MDLCGHLMKRCHQTQKFVLPEPVSLINPKETEQIEFSEEENKENLRRCKKKKFYDQKVCRHLCSNTLVLKSTRTHPITPCESICFELIRSSASAGDVCPSEKYCKKGCPCPFYKCEKTDKDQKFIPVFNLKKSDYKRKGINGDIQEKFLELLDFSGAQTPNKMSIVIPKSQSFTHYERFS